jgi:DNA-binding MarR family transcriptional regulator
MSLQATKAVWLDNSFRDQGRNGPGEKLVMLCLAFFDGKNGCYPSLDLISGFTCMAKTNVVKILKRLEKRGQIEKSPAASKRAGVGIQTSINYAQKQ